LSFSKVAAKLSDDDTSTFCRARSRSSSKASRPGDQHVPSIRGLEPTPYTSIKVPDSTPILIQARLHLHNAFRDDKIVPALSPSLLFSFTGSHDGSLRCRGSHARCRSSSEQRCGGRSWSLTHLVGLVETLIRFHLN
jgi:hypothetical protein